MKVAPAVRVDPGLQPERTSLSWVRCAASSAALAVLFVRCMGSAPASAAVGGTVLLCAAVLLCTARRRHRRSCEDFEREYAPPQWGWNMLLLVTVLGPAVAGAVMVVQDSL